MHDNNITDWEKSIDKNRGKKITSIGFNWNHYEKDKNKSIKHTVRQY